MALAVDVVALEWQGDSAQVLAVQYASSMTAPERQRLHITVGTRDSGILPVEAKALVKSWRSVEEDRERRTLKLGDIITVKARIAGLSIGGRSGGVSSRIPRQTQQNYSFYI
jgi:tRNA ligase